MEKRPPISQELNFQTVKCWLNCEMILLSLRCVMVYIRVVRILRNWILEITSLKLAAKPHGNQTLFWGSFCRIPAPCLWMQINGGHMTGGPVERKDAMPSKKSPRVRLSVTGYATLQMPSWHNCILESSGSFVVATVHLESWRHA